MIIIGRFKKISLLVVACFTCNLLLYAGHKDDKQQLSSAVVENVVALPIKPLQHYFVKNSFADDGEMKLLRITDQKEMDSIFGTAPVMGDGGQPTKVDFRKEQLVAIIAPVSATIDLLQINSIVKSYNQINLNYSLSESESKKSYTSRHFVLLSIDKQLKSRIVAQRENIPGSDIDEFGCKPSTGYFWSSLKQKCIGPGDNEDLLIISNGQENLPVIFNKQRSIAEVIHLQFDNCPPNLQLRKDKVKGKVLERWKGEDIVLERTQEGYKLYKGGRLIFN